MYREQLKRLCNEQTELKPSDIEFLIKNADGLMTSSNYPDDDVFIDVKNAFSEDATVVFHKKPVIRESLYERTVVGNIASLKNEPAVIRTLNTGVPSIGLSAVSQEGVAIKQTVFPIFHDGRVIATLILEKEEIGIAKDGSSFDVPLSGKSEVQFAFLEHLEDAVLIFNQDGKLMYCNQVALETYRNKLAYLDSISDLHYDNLILGHTNFAELAQYSKSFSSSFFLTEELQYGPYHFLVKLYSISEPKAIVVVCKDMTSSKQVENQLLLAETALREMNHRVKNNLQTAVSLLRLQAQRSKSVDVKKSLYDSVNRVLSIATIHDLLSQQQSDEVLIDDLLQGVIDNLQPYLQGRMDINFTYRIDPGIFLDSNRATSVALIVNELLQNSYDHAFNTKIIENPEIYLQVRKENDIIKLKVADNGGGYNVEETFENRLGLVIVERFVKSKLLGKLSIISDETGTSTSISFK